MHELEAYRVTKSSTNDMVRIGDIIWISEDETLNIVFATGGGKTLAPPHWQQWDTGDFEFEPAKDYIVCVTKDGETLVKKTEYRLKKCQGR